MTLKNKVAERLKSCNKCREDDAHLTMHIWVTYHPSKVRLDEDRHYYVYLSDIYSLPREDHVKRVRAVIQNVEGKYLPLNPEVRRKRKISEADWRKYLGYNQSVELELSSRVWGDE
jgi:hypothetical protein